MSNINDDIKISELPILTLTENSIFVTDDLINGDYETENHLLSEIGSKVFTSFAYTQDLETTNKTIVGAINEVQTQYGRYHIDGLLEAGETTVTINNAHITATSVIDYFGDVAPIDVTIAVGSITLTFLEREEDYRFSLEVK